MGLQSFDSLDDMLNSMEKDRKIADSKATDWQKKLKKGDYFIREAEGITIYGEVLGGGRKTYKFSKCYSTFCPKGEMGDVHVSTIQRRISKEEFEYAKERNWE